MKQQILDLIRANPNIRTVEISDKLDIDLDRKSTRLNSSH